MKNSLVEEEEKVNLEKYKENLKKLHEEDIKLKNKNIIVLSSGVKVDKNFANKLKSLEKKIGDDPVLNLFTFLF